MQGDPWKPARRRRDTALYLALVPVAAVVVPALLAYSALTGAGRRVAGKLRRRGERQDLSISPDPGPGRSLQARYCAPRGSGSGGSAATPGRPARPGDYPGGQSGRICRARSADEGP